MIRQFLEALASLKLTVALLSMALFLIFAGTLAQVELGIWQAVEAYFRSPLAWVDVQLFIPRTLAETALQIPFPGGLTIGILMVVNLLAAHALRFRMIRSRIGIVMLHAGLIVLLAGEFVTGMFSREGVMRIDVDGSSHHVEDLRTTELAVIDPSGATTDRVISLPQEMVSESAGKERLSHAALPFEIEVLDWMPNARLVRAEDGKPADRGVGLDAEAELIPEVRGVDGAATNAPAAYVTLHAGGERLGTWLLSADLIDAQPVEVGGKTYGIALRFKRSYKPYTLHLLEFRHDKFVGTEVARNFSSRVRVEDPTRGTDREVVIWMNNPLRYAGETFYQASYKPDGSGTVLQVVRNPGALLPYVACGLVSLGMTLHFVMMLSGFLRRERTVSIAAESAAEAPSRWAVLTPWVAGAMGLLIASHMLLRPAPKSEFDFAGFGSLPVSSGGRVKPVDTAARHLLSVAGGRQSVRTDEGRISAVEFLLDLIARPESIKDLPVVRVDHPDVLNLLGLKPEDAGRISLGAIEPHWQSVSEQAMRASELAPRERDAFHRDVLNLHNRVNEMLSHAAMQAPYAIPPYGPDGEWQPFSEAFRAEQEAPKGHPAVAFQVAMMTAYSEGDAPAFNKAVAGYRALLERDMGPTLRDSRFEVLFNRAMLFLGAMEVYILAFLLVCASLLMRMRSAAGAVLPERLRLAAVGLLWAAFLVHTAAILLRIHLQGRPPVTNLYSSAVFVGWAAVLFGLILERLYKLGIAALGAAAIGFATLVIAHNLGTDGDTMQMMQAVLDSNFWLATHVITITLGYSATLLAGTLAIVHLLLGVFTRQLTADRSRALTRMVYGVVCFAMLLSFVGTVLGGIWADQSWGRFWGWDPKENGAALVVLINAIILHARWGGIIRERGIMVLAVSGNIVTAWSWFGTNMLGVGLHSYGFMDSAVFWMMAFVVSQLAVMAVGLTPLTAWRSQFRTRAA